MKIIQRNVSEKITILLLSIGLFSYLIAQERITSFDEKGKLYTINSKLGKKLSLFKEYQNFQEARLFQLSDSLYVLEIYYKPKNELLKARVSLDYSQVMDLRHKIITELYQKSPKTILNQEGRSRFVWNARLLSLLYYGWATPIALDIDDSKLAVATYMLLGGIGFYLPYSYTSNIEVTDAAATLSHYLGTRGIIHGFFIPSLINKSPSYRTRFTYSMLASVTEFVLGFKIANRLKLTSGSAEVVGITGDFGLLLGCGIADLLNFTVENKARASSACILIGSYLGYKSGLSISKTQPFTRGDAYIYRATGILGIQIPQALVDLFKPKEHRIYTASSIVGGIIGAMLGCHLVRNKDFTSDQGKFVLWSEAAGDFIGSGIAYLISSEKKYDTTIYLTLSSIGATAGFWLMYKNFKDKAQIEEANLPLEIGFYPETLLTALNRKNINSFHPAPRTFFSIDYKF
ncbi:MAG: hypothetical protein H0Z29_08165 [Candidatus Marinimicrobia bacterium]|nr:hypothetical protein [Candidatus Neomarinimicrobiota bacterium]